MAYGFSASGFSWHGFSTDPPTSGPNQWWCAVVRDGRHADADGRHRGGCGGRRGQCGARSLRRDKLADRLMATLTIKTTAAQDARIAGAFGKRLNLGRNANLDEVKQQVVMFLVNVVQEYGRRDAHAAADAALPALISPT